MGSYHTTSAATATELVGKIKDFCTGHGWSSWTDSDILGRWVVKSPLGAPVCLWASVSNFYMQGVDSGTPNALAGHTAAMALYDHTVAELHLLAYDDPDIVYFIIKFSNGVYRQGVIGEIAKLGEYTGGTVFYVTNHADEGSYYANRWPTGNAGNRLLFSANTTEGGLYIDNGEGPNWRPWGNGDTSSEYYAGFGGGSDGYIRINHVNYYDTAYFSWGHSHSAFNWSTHLITMPLYVTRPNNLMSPIGWAPFLRVTKGIAFSPDQIIDVGGDLYRVWPMIKHSTPKNNESGSYDYYYCFYVETGQETPTSV